MIFEIELSSGNKIKIRMKSFGKFFINTAFTHLYPIRSIVKRNVGMVILILTISACEDHPSVLKKNEKIEYYTDSPNLIFKKTVRKTDYDSVYYFYRSGNLFKKGKQTKQKQKFGNWNLYDKDSNLREIREWFTLKGSSQINRAWFLNRKGDTIAWRKEDKIFDQLEFVNDTLGFRNTNYNTFNFITKDTINIAEYYYAFANCGSPLLRDYSSKVKIIVDHSNSLKKDFSNEKKVKLDTFYYAKIDTIHKLDFPGYDLEKVVAFSGKFKEPGQKIIRGYMIEYSGQFPVEKNIKGKAESRTYFEKKIYVKDSIE